MDGIRSRTTRTRSRALTGLTLAICSLGWGAAPAFADPAVDFGAGTPALQTSQDLARAHWATDPCGGQVTVVWMDLDKGTNATSTWLNPVGQYDAPAQNTSCQIAFNRSLSWDFTKFCSVLAHEYGHLSGHAHSQDAGDLMYPYYEKPVAECAAAAPAQPIATSVPADAAAVAPAAAPAPQTSSSAQLRVARVASHPRVRYGMIRVVREPRHAKRHHRRRARPTRPKRSHSRAWYRRWIRMHRGA